MIEERTEQLASLHALGLLTGEETAYFEDLVRTNPEVAALARELQDSAAELVYLAPALKPSASVRSNLLAQIRSETESTSLPQAPQAKRDSMPWAIAASLAVLAGILIYDRSETHRELASLKGIHAEALKELADLRDEDKLSKLRIATLSSKMNNSPETVGSVAWDGDKQRGVLTLEKIPPPGPAQDYQLWIIDPQYPQPISGGIVHVDEHGDARIVFKVEVPIHAADKFAVSRERKGGVESAQGPIVMIGE